MSDMQIHARITIDVDVARDAALERCREMIVSAPGTAPDPDRAARLALTGELVRAVTTGLRQSPVAEHLGAPAVRIDVSSPGAPS